MMYLILFLLCCNSTYRLRYWNHERWTLMWHHLLRRLQQYLPFTVLKLGLLGLQNEDRLLQQYLPFTVLKRHNDLSCTLFYMRCNSTYRLRYWNLSSIPLTGKLETVATVLTVYGIETFNILSVRFSKAVVGCNSTYRLRYWNAASLPTDGNVISKELQQYLPFTVLKPMVFFNIERYTFVVTVLTVYGIETI